MDFEHKKTGIEVDLSVLKIIRIYLKDVRCYSAGTPYMFFKQENLQHQVNLNVNVKHQKIDGNYHEIQLRIDLAFNHEEEKQLELSISQAGIFVINTTKVEQKNYFCLSYCPNILLPYAREVISDITNKAGLPAFTLEQFDFNSLYAQHQQDILKSKTSAH